VQEKYLLIFWWEAPRGSIRSLQVNGRFGGGVKRRATYPGTALDRQRRLFNFTNPGQKHVVLSLDDSIRWKVG
jgi:hypothetical protein